MRCTIEAYKGDPLQFIHFHGRKDHRPLLVRFNARGEYPAPNREVFIWDRDALASSPVFGGKLREKLISDLEAKFEANAQDIMADLKHS